MCHVDIHENHQQKAIAAAAAGNAACTAEASG